MFDRRNFGKFVVIRQILQRFPLPKFPSIWYVVNYGGFCGSLSPRSYICYSLLMYAWLSGFYSTLQCTECFYPCLPLRCTVRGIHMYKQLLHKYLSSKYVCVLLYSYIHGFLKPCACRPQPSTCLVSWNCFCPWRRYACLFFCVCVCPPPRL